MRKLLHIRLHAISDFVVCTVQDVAAEIALILEYKKRWSG